MLKHSGSATRQGADSPDERGTTESGGAGVRPRSRSFCGEKLYFGARPRYFYLVMARMKVAMDMSIEVMVKKMLVEELKKALRASDFLGST